MHMGKVVSVESHDLETALGDTANDNGKRLRTNGYLLELALKWLRADLEERGARQKKPKWEDIEKDMLEHAPLERNSEDGFAKYFRASRARD